MSTPSLSILNSMAGRDFSAALDRHVEWRIQQLDLKDCIFGKSISELTDLEAQRARDEIVARGLSVYCLSSSVFASDVEVGEDAFRKRHDPALKRILAVARILKPAYVRLIGAQTSRRKEIPNSTSYLNEHHPWVFKAYGDAIDRIFDAGFKTVIENEVENQILIHAREIRDFFSMIERPHKVRFTWDIANSWQASAFPSLATYRELTPIIGYIHVKGGKPGASGALAYASSLRDTTWPVREILSEAIRDGVSPVICLNPPHGAPAPGDDSSSVTERDLTFMRDLLAANGQQPYATGSSITRA